MQNLTLPISQRAVALPKLYRLSLRCLWLAGVIIIVFFLASYIIQLARLTEDIFLIEDLQKKTSWLVQRNEELSESLSKSSLPKKLESRLRNLNYVEADKIHYIRLLEGTMAAK